MKKPTGRPSKWPLEMRKMIAEKVISGELTIRGAAMKYNVSHGAITDWKRRHMAGTLAAMAPPPDPSEDIKQYEALKNENAMLKQELGDLYLENRLLKKAADWVQCAKKESSLIITPENLDRFKEPAKQ